MIGIRCPIPLSSLYLHHKAVTILRYKIYFKFDETHAMQISEYLCFTYQIVAFFSGSKKNHEFGTIEIPKSACFA